MRGVLALAALSIVPSVAVYTLDIANGWWTFLTCVAACVSFALVAFATAQEDNE